MGLISQRMYESDYERQRNQFHAHSKMELIDTVNVQVSWPRDMYGSHSHNKHMALALFLANVQVSLPKGMYHHEE